MTPQQAAYECMQRVTRRLGYAALTVEFVEQVEREFTEIISQVTPRDPREVAALQVEQCERNAAFDRWKRDNGWAERFPQEIDEPQLRRDTFRERLMRAAQEANAPIHLPRFPWRMWRMMIRGWFA